MVSVGVMDRTKVRITIRIKEMVGVRSIITYRYSTCFWCAVTEYVPLNRSHTNFCSTDIDFSLYQQTSVFMWSRFHRQWQECPTPELVNTTTSEVNKQLRRSKILQTEFIQSNTNGD